MYMLRYVDSKGLTHWWKYPKECQSIQEANEIFEIFKRYAKENNIDWKYIDRELW